MTSCIRLWTLDSPLRLQTIKNPEVFSWFHLYFVPAQFAIFVQPNFDGSLCLVLHGRAYSQNSFTYIVFLFAIIILISLSGWNCYLGATPGFCFHNAVANRDLSWLELSGHNSNPKLVVRPASYPAQGWSRMQHNPWQGECIPLPLGSAAVAQIGLLESALPKSMVQIQAV